MRNSKVVSIKNDIKLLIRKAKEDLENDNLPDELKGLLIITIYAAANSLYEKFTKEVLRELLDNKFRLFIDINKEADSYLLLKYRSGKKLEFMDYIELNNFIDNKPSEAILKEQFINDYKALGKIREIKQLIIARLTIKRIDRRLSTKIGISLDNLIEQLHIDYTDIRTRVIHGDYKDFKTAFYLWRGNAMSFLYRVYAAINLINYAAQKLK